MANKRRDAGKERFWRDVLKRHAASGLSVRAFCEREKLTESAVLRLAANDYPARWQGCPNHSDSDPPAVGFLPVCLSGVPSPVCRGVDHDRAGRRAGTAAAGIDRSEWLKWCWPWKEDAPMIAPDLAGVQVWVATTPVDMRKSFDGLAEVVRVPGARPALGQPVRVPQQGRAPVKILWWDTNGLAIYYKRLERGEFRLPRAKGLPSPSRAGSLATVRGPDRRVACGR